LGFSLIELMVAITIGLAVLAGLTTIFSNSSATYGELEKTAQQIENGRYAIDLIGQDLRHAGFYGQFQGSTATPAALPDPCEVANLANLNAGLALPVQARAQRTSTRIRRHRGRAASASALCSQPPT